MAVAERDSVSTFQKPPVRHRDCYGRAMPRPKRRTDTLRERGVASALAVLAEDGVAGLTTRSVALRAEASVPAIYEVFGDKGGLIREVFFHGFRMLGDELGALPATNDPVAGLLQLCDGFRRFVVENRVLAQVMFSRPFVDFAPTAQDNKAGLKVSKLFVHHARAAVDAGALVGDPTDIAHLFFALVEGLSAAESAHRLGGSKQAVNRRWRLGLNALIGGLSPLHTASRTSRSTSSARKAE
jgi:AcrR family transcriptional regulator